MSDLYLNKLAFCVLGAGLLMTGLSEASGALFKRETPPHIIVEPPPPTEPEVRDYHVLFELADAVAGKTVSVKCQQCHNLEAGGGVLVGPPLYGVLGRDIGSAPGFKYSTGAGSIGALDGAWTYEKLDHFLELPKAFASGTAMNFPGLRVLKDRINLIAYLRTLTSGEPEPLP